MIDCENGHNSFLPHNEIFCNVTLKFSHQEVECVKVAQSCLTLCDPHGLIQSMEFSRPEYWSG